VARCSCSIPHAPVFHRRQCDVSERRFDADTFGCLVELRPDALAVEPHRGPDHPLHRATVVIAGTSGADHRRGRPGRVAMHDQVTQTSQLVDLRTRVPTVLPCRPWRSGQSVASLPRPDRRDRDLQRAGDGRDREAVTDLGCLSVHGPMLRAPPTSNLCILTMHARVEWRHVGCWGARRVSDVRNVRTSLPTMCRGQLGTLHRRRHPPPGEPPSGRDSSTPETWPAAMVGTRNRERPGPGSLPCSSPPADRPYGSRDGARVILHGADDLSSRRHRVFPT
jgi:hypothetical protein